MIHELRIYHCLPGRLQDVLTRFETATLPIWERHGIRAVGFWTTIVGPSNLDLHYILAWASLAEREERWAAFQNDPEWVEKRTASERNGPLIASQSNALLQPTAFSQMG